MDPFESFTDFDLSDTDLDVDIEDDVVHLAASNFSKFVASNDFVPTSGGICKRNSLCYPGKWREG